MSEPAQYLDSHMHLDIVHHCHPDRIQWLKDNGCAVVSWAFSPREGETAELARYLKFQAETIQSINEQGLPCRFLAGIHPRNIPGDMDPAQCTEFLGPFLAHPLCLGIGEIGLETGEAREIEFFTAQLAAARDAGKNCRTGVHTPRKNKPEITSTVLDVLDCFHELHGRLVVDHCTPETIESVLDHGWMAGITLSPVKSSLADLQAIFKVRPDCAARIMCNTDSGMDFYEDLLISNDCFKRSLETRRALFGGNAADFFNWRPGPCLNAASEA
ncbi:MAG TPA: TatD family hydrolase [Kiritimatiellia bacterium]|nr:TatD family hydrolase [Kiritimatiellia bacterium]